MRDILAHRGPDDYGMLATDSVVLGHRRLSIVDVLGGRQPMSNEDDSIHIVFNGEIYNHCDFRQWLEERGHVYKNRSDTETILHLYEEMGPLAVNSLRGMFAFAIWDSRTRELILARDRLGIKPLYYAQNGDGSLYFASEIKSLLASGGVSAELNYPALPDYLANHATSGEETLFKGVNRLLPGHILRWQDGRVRLEKYWEIEFPPERQNGSVPAAPENRLIKEWSDLFRTAVESHLMADVPLGMFLSGGIDSSAIAAVMSGMVRDPIKTFSVAFAEREANELQYARLVAERFQTDHHETIVTPDEFFSVLPKLVWHEDEPLAHPSSVALYFVSRLAAQHVKVVLTGEGSDELLGGYERYRKTLINLALGSRYDNWAPPALQRYARSAIEHLPIGMSGRRKLLRTFLYRKPELEGIYFDNFSVFGTELQSQLFSGATKERVGIDRLNPYTTLNGLVHGNNGASLLDKLLFADMKTYLQELLMKQDQMSMAASIESRVPFLDHKLVEFTCGLPDRLKIRGWTTKYVLRRSMQNLLPQEVLRRRKMGFPVPVGAWFRGRFRGVLEEYVLGARPQSRGLFQQEVVQRIAAEHNQGLADHSERLWALVNFEMWQRQFIDGEALGREDLETERCAILN